MQKLCDAKGNASYSAQASDAKFLPLACRRVYVSEGEVAFIMDAGLNSSTRQRISRGRCSALSARSQENSVARADLSPIAANTGIVKAVKICFVDHGILEHTDSRGKG